MLSGIASQRPSSTNMLAAETPTLKRLGFATGAALLDALVRAPSAEGPTGLDTFQAAAIYLRTCTYEWAKSRGNPGNRMAVVPAMRGYTSTGWNMD
jgi:hypothetical protein